MRQFWLILGLLILAGVAGRAVVSRRRQLRALRRLARERRLNFSPEDLIDVRDRYHNLELIRQGHSRHACNVLHGPTDAGLLTVFSYSYDLGFGPRRASAYWWLAVVETAGVHEHWRAGPANSAPPQDETQIDRFNIRADHEETLQKLIDAGIERVFQASPADCHWEVRGPLVAVAAPFGSVPEVPRQLLTTACDLARILAPATS